MAKKISDNHKGIPSKGFGNKKKKKRKPQKRNPDRPHGNTGNQYWLNRFTFGRDKIFTPESLKQEAGEYFKWVDEHPLEVEELKVVSTGNYKTTAKNFKSNRKRVYTLTGLCLFLGVTSTYWSVFKSDIKNSTEDKEPRKFEYLKIIRAIEDIIYTQKYEGAAGGLFKEQFIAKDLGLSDFNIKKDSMDDPDSPTTTVIPTITITVHK